MNIKLLLLCYVLFFSLHACAQKANSGNPIAKMGWLVGSWQGTYKGQPFYESWKKKNDSTLVNLTIEVNKSDTIVKENGAMMYSSRGVVYVGGSGQWNLTHLTDTSIILSNDTLQYANRITWSHSKQDHWIAVIQNPQNVIEYDLVRVEWLDRYVDDFIGRMMRLKR